jgi:hypothetical protein
MSLDSRAADKDPRGSCVDVFCNVSSIETQADDSTSAEFSGFAISEASFNGTHVKTVR